ncbi:MAG: DUF917 domain-containing protein [Anaerolineae bacterium]|nr:DUF917 domain-containing protein [Anaerolineae bacterium]
MTLKTVTLDDIEAISLGAGILGTGGGGNPYLGSLHLREIIRRHGPARVIDPFDLPDDAVVVMAGFIGAPTASIEKIEQGEELLTALRAFEAHLGRRATAVGIAEIGGANCFNPIVLAIQAGLPVVDCDAMGRAFPELPMSVFFFEAELPVTPLALVDAAGNRVVIPTTAGAQWAERLARTLATRMGGTAGLIASQVPGKDIKTYGIHYTLSLARDLGGRVLRSGEDDIPGVIADTLQGRVIMRGKIADLERRTTRGFARGALTIEGFGSRDRLFIEFQNEFLIARLNGEVVITVPDLISIVTEDTGEPISTEVLRYGMRVAVLGIPAAQGLKTPKALAVVGPRAFGYEVDFHPLPGGIIGQRPAI